MSYDSELSDVLMRRDWEALREFCRTHNQIPDDIYGKDAHFWEVLMHKITCNRLETLGLQADSRSWLQQRGYSTDLAGY